MEEHLSGTDWRAEELDEIIADYFDMLAADVSGAPYVKSQHRAALVSRLGRSDGAIEFKHQNISAVLDKLGAPWIPGYKPAKNYQAALFDAIDRYLADRPFALDLPLSQRPSVPSFPEVFVPLPVPDTAPLPERLQRLVRKYVL